MKKNKAMRLASVLLVLTLLTTCMTAGTFAKYTTGAEGTSTARVAKFGVNVSVDAGNVFGKNYKSQVDGNGVTVEGNGITVKADEMVVAPGTKGEMTFSITGTPETKVDLSISLGDENALKEVMLKNGIYKDVTKNKETFELTDAYYPVKWTLQNDEKTVVGQMEDKKLSEINTYLKETVSTAYDANTDLTSIMGGNGTYTLSWEWDFAANDKADTLLGQLAVKPNLLAKSTANGSQFEALTKGTDYCLEEAFKLTISVTQVD